jgi:hypothetical protein
MNTKPSTPNVLPVTFTFKTDQVIGDVAGAAELAQQITELRGKREGLEAIGSTALTDLAEQTVRDKQTQLAQDIGNTVLRPRQLIDKEQGTLQERLQSLWDRHNNDAVAHRERRNKHVAEERAKLEKDAQEIEAYIGMPLKDRDEALDRAARKAVVIKGPAGYSKRNEKIIATVRGLKELKRLSRSIASSQEVALPFLPPEEFVEEKPVEPVEIKTPEDPIATQPAQDAPPAAVQAEKTEIVQTLTKPAERLTQEELRDRLPDIFSDYRGTPLSNKQLAQIAYGVENPTPLQIQSVKNVWMGKGRIAVQETLIERKDDSLFLLRGRRTHGRLREAIFLAEAPSRSADRSPVEENPDDGSSIQWENIPKPAPTKTAGKTSGRKPAPGRRKSKTARIT